MLDLPVKTIDVMHIVIAVFATLCLTIGANFTLAAGHQRGEINFCE